MKNILLCLFLLITTCFSDVLSTDGKIRFDTEADGQPEMTLNSTGLSIGALLPSSNLNVNGNAIISEQLFVGGSSGSSTLNVNGTIGFGFQTISSNTTLGDSSIVLVDSSSDNITITLPYAGNVSGRQYQIKKISTSNSIWVSGGGNLIDDTSPIELSESNNLASVKLISDGMQWYQLEEIDVNESVAQSNLLGWWKFDEVSGNVASDSNGRNLYATIINGGTFSSNGITAKFKNGLVFDGVDDYVSTEDDSSFNLIQEFSVSCWIKTNEGTDNYIFTKNNGNSLYLRVSASKVKFWISTSSAVWTTGTKNVDDNEWHHIVVMRRGDLKLIYVDGLEDASAAATGNNSTGGAIGFRIGCRDVNYFQGIIDDFRVFDKALTPAEVLALYNQGQ